MKAMVFAAGRGSRLGALTATRPKALIEVDGVPLLEIVLTRLREAGVQEVIINVHHLGQQIESFIAARAGCGLRVTFSREDTLLDTGGGLKHAAGFFSDQQPFFVHNVDVLSDIDLRTMMQAHVTRGGLATLAVKTRPTARPLLFDAGDRLCGKVGPGGEQLVRTGVAPLRRVGFCGVHVMSPALFSRITETGAFSIIESYLRLAREEAAIFGFGVDAFRWRDCGRPEDLRSWSL